MVTQIRTALASASLAASFLLLDGCVPAISTYYRVNSSEGTTRGYCTDVGPPVAVELKRGDVVVVIHDIRDPIKPYINQNWFSVDIFIHSKTDVVEFAPEKLMVFDDESGKALPVQVHVVTGRNLPGVGEKIQIESTLEGSKYDDYTIEYVFTGAISSKFHIQFPEMQVNHIAYPGLHVEYTKDSGVFVRC
jgi:hypothetical protein